MIVDEQVREDILNSSGNIMVSASAGSGKTTIMTKKILKKLNEILDHRTVAALTFTVKATQEIKRKIKHQGSYKDFVVMTNDAFIEHELIRPFLIDAFGEQYQNNFVVTYNATYKVSTFQECMSILKKENKLGGYSDNHRNFKFELAKKILEQSQAAREYFRAKYTMLFLDEYQDSDMDMHRLFMYIKNNLEIDIFIVGDSKQAIYLWRGAQRNIFNLLSNEGMQRFELLNNFRSHIEIVNYANLMHNTSQFISYEENVTNVVHCITNDALDSIAILLEIGELDKNKSITIVANVNRHAQSIANRLNEYGFNFIFIPKTPIDDSSDHSSILRAISCYILDINYSVYDVAEVLRIEQIRSVLNRIESLLKPLKEIIPLPTNTSKEEVRDSFIEILTQFNNYFDLSISDVEISLLLDALANEMYHSAFIKSDDLHKVMTVFGTKGLEFKQVISFSGYYNFNNESEKNNHYVCTTRAEEKFIMMENGNYSSKIIENATELGITDTKFLFKVIDHT